MKSLNFVLPATGIIILLLSIQANAQTRLIGFIKTPPSDSFGCYFVIPGDINKTSRARHYLFAGDENGAGLANIDGVDVKVKSDKSSPVKLLKGKRGFVWIYSAIDADAKVVLRLVPTKTTNDGENVHFDAVIEAHKGSRSQSLKAQGFCGG